MAKYWLMPNDMDKVTAYNAHLATQLELYKDYDVDKPEIHIDYKEPNARRDIMAMVKRRDYNLISEEDKTIILAK